MKKEVNKGFWSTFVRVPLTLIIASGYLVIALYEWTVALSNTSSYVTPSDGNKALLVLCLVSIGALWVLAFRLMDVHHWRSFRELKRPVGLLTLLLVLYAAVHGFGTFAPEKYQDWIMFTPLITSFFIAFVVNGRLLVNREALRHEVSRAQRATTLSKTDTETQQERIL